MKIEIPDYIADIIEKLNESGYSAYIVGGCVRDSLLGKTPADYDIATSALPEETKAVFSDMHIVETGIKHGTVSLITKNGAIEVTTFRTDGEYKDHRRPESVSFSRTLSDDLSRRDFTVNALAYHHSEGIYDFFGGIYDLENKILRSVGNAEKRFFEDALRILRAARFCSTLGFLVEEETFLAAEKLSSLLGSISRERVKLELEKLICGKNARSSVLRFEKIINSALGTNESFSHFLSEKLPPLPDLRFAELLKRLNADGAKKIMQGLKSEKKLTSSVEALIADSFFTYSDKTAVKKLISKRGYEHAQKLALFIHDEKLLSEILSIKKENPCLDIKTLAANGTDLLCAGIKSEKIGKIQKELLLLVIEEKLSNDRQLLIEAAKSLNI